MDIEHIANSVDLPSGQYRANINLKNMEEQWKEIDETHGYKISNKGRILNTKTGKIQIGSNNGYGYLRLDLRRRKLGRIVIHRLVAKYFLETWNKDLIVNHKDGNKSNNNVLNLEMVTASENIKHAINTGLLPVNYGENAPNFKLSNSIVEQIHQQLQTAKRKQNGYLAYGEAKRIANEIGVNKSFVLEYSRRRKGRINVSVTTIPKGSKLQVELKRNESQVD